MKDKANLLDEGFRQRQDNYSAIPDPKIPMEIVLTLDQLDTYDKNPRQALNEKFDEIKESIRISGLHQQLIVTKRPNTDIFIIKRGGNTRLACLKELWEETQDERFYRLTCKFEPWTSDADLIGAHMAENEVRGDMLFIDKALAARSLKNHLEAESGTELSQREFVAEAAKTGWIINLSLLNSYLYVANILYPLIPTALMHGMGRPAVRQIRKVVDSFNQWAEMHNDPDLPPSKLEMIYYSLLKQADAADEINLLERKALDNVESDASEQIARLANMHYASFRMEVEALQDNVSAAKVLETRSLAPQFNNEERDYPTTNTTVAQSAQNEVISDHQTQHNDPVTPVGQNAFVEAVRDIPASTTEVSSPNPASPVITSPQTTASQFQQQPVLPPMQTVPEPAPTSKKFKPYQPFKPTDTPVTAQQILRIDTDRPEVDADYRELILRNLSNPVTERDIFLAKQAIVDCLSGFDDIDDIFNYTYKRLIHIDPYQENPLRICFQFTDDDLATLPEGIIKVWHSDLYQQVLALIKVEEMIMDQFFEFLRDNKIEADKGIEGQMPYFMCIGSVLTALSAESIVALKDEPFYTHYLNALARKHYYCAVPDFYLDQQSVMPLSDVHHANIVTLGQIYRQLQLLSKAVQHYLEVLWRQSLHYQPKQ